MRHSVREPPQNHVPDQNTPHRAGNESAEVFDIFYSDWTLDSSWKRSQCHVFTDLGSGFMDPPLYSPGFSSSGPLTLSASRRPGRGLWCSLEPVRVVEVWWWSLIRVYVKSVQRAAFKHTHYYTHT